MKKTIITFGLISGAISSILMVSTMPLNHRIGYDKAVILGYTSIVLSFLLVYFGIRSYRDNVTHGHIGFGKAFGVGICITLISCALYVATWEVLSHTAFPNFLDDYSASMIVKAQASGLSPEALKAKIDEIQKMKAMLANPVYNVLMTFIEPFPVGLAITLISAAVLRKKAMPDQSQSPAMA